MWVCNFPDEFIRGAKHTAFRVRQAGSDESDETIALKLQSSPVTRMSLRTRFVPLVIGFVCVFMGTYDATAWGVVIPAVADQLELDLIVTQWVVLAPIVVNASLLLVMGNLADKIGHRRVLYFGLTSYVIAALLVTLSSGFALLIVARFLAGASFAVLFTVGSAFTVRAFVPAQRARALATVGICSSIGLVLGPLIGGLIAAEFGWRQLYLVPLAVLAICLIAIVIAVRVRLCERLWETPRRPRRRFDLPGAVLMFAWLGPLLYAITLGNDRGWLSVEIIGAAIVGLLALLAFFRLQLNALEPTLNFRFFKVRDFRLPVAAEYLGFVAGSVGFLLLPIYMAKVLGYSPFLIGIVIALGPAMILFTAPLAGIWADRSSPRRPATAGLLLVAFGSAVMLLLQADSPIWLLFVLTPVAGLGFGAFEWTVSTSIVGALPSSMLGVSAGFFATAKTLGFVTGQALWGLTFTIAVTTKAGTTEALAAGPEDLMFGFRFCLAASVLIGLFAAFLAMRQRDNPRSLSDAEIAALRSG